MNEFERLFGQQQSVRLLQSIEVAVWSIAALLLVIVALLFLAGLKRHRAKQHESNWPEIIEKAYDAGEYGKALQTLGSYELHFPRSALIKYWQGKCLFQQESWKEAVERFETCCRLEPPYRTSVREYMAFIELNQLVPGVTGYLEKGKSASSDAGASA